MSENTGGKIDTVMHEDRLFPPSEEFASKASIGSLDAYQKLYDEAKSDPVAFWGNLAKEELRLGDDMVLLGVVWVPEDTGRGALGLQAPEKLHLATLRPPAGCAGPRGWPLLDSCEASSRKLPKRLRPRLSFSSRPTFSGAKKLSASPS